MKTLFTIVLAGILLAACNNSENKNKSAAQASQNQVVIANDMENALGMIPSWKNERTVIQMKDPKAYSGDYACVTNDTLEYSYSYTELFKNINEKLPKSVTYHGWAYSSVANPDFSIICNINADTSRYQWKPFPLKEQLSQANKWTEFTTSFDFDKPLKPEYEIALVAWNLSKKQVYLDDLEITFYY